ncbi:MAG: hypothetical protein PGN07_00255 [Aeromicrobium erythreum]
MNELYRSLAAWSGSNRRAIGRVTTFRGAPQHTLRRRVALARSISERADDTRQAAA